MNIVLRILIPFSICLLLLPACMDDDNWIKKETIQLPGKGVFVINEGNFTFGNASLDFYNPENGEVINELFIKSSALPLGDVAQSMSILNQKGFVVINNSGKVYVIDIRNGKYIGKITGLTSPRHIHFINDEKAYISDLYASAIAIVNPKTYEHTGIIVTPGHPSTEEMVQIGNRLFVSCWSNDHAILVIDTDRNKVIETIETARQPSSLVVDKNNKIWVLCDGGWQQTAGIDNRPALQRINPQTLNIEQSFYFEAGESPSSLAINSGADQLIYINKSIYTMSIDATTLPEEKLLNYNGTIYYGLGINPQTDEIYVSDAIDYSQSGVVYRLTAEGLPVDTFRTGIIPGAFCFKH